MYQQCFFCTKYHHYRKCYLNTKHYYFNIVNSSYYHLKFEFFDNNCLEQIPNNQCHFKLIKYLKRFDRINLSKVKISLIKRYKIAIIKQKNLNLKLKIQIIINQFAIFILEQPIFIDLCIIQQENKHLLNSQYLMYFKLFSEVKNLIRIITHWLILMKPKYNILFCLHLKKFLFYNFYS